MLARKNYIFLSTQAFIAIGLLAGCVVTTGPTGSGGGSSDTTGHTAATTTSSAGTGGSGVGGGATSGTGTGGGACVGETGTAVIADCEKLNIAPASGASSSCGPNLDEAPPGYGLCKRGFDLFNPGANSNLVDCLATIGVQDECNIPPLQACVDKTFKEECVIATIGTSCDGIKTTCGADPFDSAKCATDLNPFSDKGLAEMEMCINMTDPAVACQKAYDDCYTQVLTF
ncbi:MAG: hypothetical protein ABJE95_15260 [Byssovorax sp.]